MLTKIDQITLLMVLSGAIWACTAEPGSTNLIVGDTGTGELADSRTAHDLHGEAIDDGVDAEVPQVGYATPEYCGSCHPNHYEQWRGSMHAYASKDPIFIAMNKKGISETEGRLGQFCVQCHAPVASLKDRLPVSETADGFIMPIDLSDPLIGHGIQCVTCHSIESIQGTQNAQFTLSETTYYGRTGSEAANAAHPMKASALFNDPNQQSLLCGTCHDVLNPNGARLEATFSEWYGNAYNAPNDPAQHRTCQDCHMPTYRGKMTPDGPEQELHAHTFVGVDQALIPGFPNKEIQAQLVRQLLQDCAILDVRFNGVNENGAAVLVASVENINNGHNLPSGSTADRQVWVHIQVRDEEGQLMFESGMLDANDDLMDGVDGHSLRPDGDPELLLFGQFIYGADGEHVTFPWQAHTYTDNLIGPGQRRWRDYEVPVASLAGREINVVATLNYRTFPPFLIRALIESGELAPDAIEPIPIIEMERFEAQFTLP